MSIAVKYAQHPVYRFLVWFTIYAFFLNVLSSTAFAYMPPAQLQPTRNDSVIEALMGLLVSKAHADEISSVKAPSKDAVAASTGDGQGQMVSIADEGLLGVASIGSPAGSQGGSIGAADGGGAVNSVMGSYGYSYPIQVAPGRGGLEPQLALSYSSLASNGWLGKGWSMSIGKIERSTKKRVPTFDDNDEFVITLKGVSIPLVARGGEYRLKDEGLFLRIVKSGDSWQATDKDGTIYYFGQNANSQLPGSGGTFSWHLDRIEDANGNYMVFHYWPNSTGALFLERIEYSGNSITGQVPDNSVSFYRLPTTRSDPAISFQTGVRHDIDQLLGTIVVHAGDRLVRAYQLRYRSDIATPLNTSYLESIQQYGHDAVFDNDMQVIGGTALPKITANYTNTTAPAIVNFGEADAGSPISGDHLVFVADFTGDGKADIVSGDGECALYRYDPELGMIDKDNALDTGSWFAKHGDLYDRVYIGDFNGDGKSDLLVNNHANQNGKMYLSNGQGFEPAIDIGHDTDGYGNFALGDFNGDGRTDIIHSFETEENLGNPYDEGRDRYLCTRGWKMQLSTGSGFTTSQTVITSTETGMSCYASNDPMFTAGDFNGDGKTDVIMQRERLNSDNSYPTYAWSLYLSDGSELVNIWRKEQETDLSNLPFLSRAILRTSDFNGDGKSDLLATHDKHVGYRLYISTGSDFINTDQGLEPTYVHQINIGDFNGDGRSDLLVEDNSFHKQRWVGHKLYLSTGSAFAPVVENNAFDELTRYHLGDFNGDGRTDFAFTHDKEGAEDLPDCWQEEVEFCDNGENGDYCWTEIVNHCSPPEGFEGYQLYITNTDSADTVAHTMPDLLGGITTSLGAKIEVSYGPSSIWPKLEPQNSLPMVTQTVSAITVHDNMPDNPRSTTTTYSYQGGHFDIADVEFRGFGQVRAKDEVTGLTTETLYHQDDQFQGRIAWSRTIDKYNIPLIHTDNDWLIYTLDDTNENEHPRTFAFVRRSTVTKYDDDGSQLATITTDFGQGDAFSGDNAAYDAYGNLLLEVKTINNHITGETTTRWVRTEYANDEFNWILGNPTRIRTHDSDPNLAGERVLREVQMNYYEQRPWLLRQNSQVLWIAQENDFIQELITTEHNYDNYGNLTWISNPRDTSWGLTTDYSESNGLFGNTVTNALGHTIRRVYDERFGTVLEEANANNNTITYTYDELGRNTRIDYPDGSYKETQIHIEPGNHYITSSANGQYPITTAYYDNLDRNIKTVIDDGLDPIFSEIIYDAAGRVLQSSLPHFATDIIQYTTFTYDDRGRVTGQENPDTTWRETLYDAYDQIITNELGQIRTITKDELGKLRKVVESTGTETAETTYEYDLFGNLSYINGPLGNETFIYYDSLGREIAMEDPYMGDWQYRYDAAGNLEWQEDGQGRIIEMTYDELNRIETKYHHDTTRLIEYTYDQPRNEQGIEYDNIGALTTLRAGEADGLADTSTITSDYDEMGRCTREMRTISGTTYTTYRSYDINGRLDTLTYPNNAELEYHYLPMGHLDRVEMVHTDGSRSLVAEYNGHNAQGQVGTMTYGNGALTTYQYNETTHRLWKIQTEAQIDINTRELIQDLEYTFDDLGNVDLINDLRNGVDYDFGYDGLNRLITAEAISAYDPDRAYDQAYVYDMAGNMEAKTGKGAFNVTAWEDPDKHIRPASITYGPGTTGVGPRAITYNQENKPTAITYNNRTTQLRYDGAGNRMHKMNPDGLSTIYVGGIYEEHNGDPIVHIFAGGQRIASIKGGQRYYTHTDHLGSSTLVTNGDGLLVEETGYLPFGATLFRKAYNGGQWTSVYKFTGQEYDGEYDLYNYNARLYDPITCRFITADTVVPDWTSPQTLNRYAYCANNPLKYIDPSGHHPLFAAVMWGMAMGAAMGAAAAMHNGGNVLKGMTQGAILGAISGAMFYGAGQAAVWLAANSTFAVTSATTAAIHFATGSIAGAANAAISGGDIGQGALIGGLSAGAAKYIGGEAGLKLPGRMAVGAAVGGLAAEMSGGDFAEGAFFGAWNAAVAHLCNSWLHPREDFSIDYDKGEIWFEKELIAERNANGDWVVDPLAREIIVVPENQYQEHSVAVDICDRLAGTVQYYRIRPWLKGASIVASIGSAFSSGGVSALWWAAGGAIDFYGAYNSTNALDKGTQIAAPFLSNPKFRYFGKGAGVGSSLYHAIR